LTEFAPARRDSPDQIESDRRYFETIQGSGMLDATPNIFIILNDKRQVVFANAAMRQMVHYGNGHGTILYGERPGEVMACTYADDGPGGCGTSSYCSQCGAVKAVLRSLKGKVAVTEDCHILLKSGDALDLRVTATPFHEDARDFVMVAIEDISNDKRRRILERLFFHDVLNTTGILMSATDLLREGNATFDEMSDMIHYAVQRLTDEIKNQQILSAAENNDLTAKPTHLDPAELLASVARSAQHYEFAHDIPIQVNVPPEGNPPLHSDPVLLTRVLTNLLKNALEASSRGDTVSLSCQNDDDSITFAVHNPAHMPYSVQLQVFKRSFSTKGADRGLGTYSIKLLAERYLGGRVWFESDQENGTTFKVQLPLTTDTPC
jgi:K+-sensing histidine kinase KdpD